MDIFAQVERGRKVVWPDVAAAMAAGDREAVFELSLGLMFAEWLQSGRFSWALCPVLNRGGASNHGVLVASRWELTGDAAERSASGSSPGSQPGHAVAAAAARMRPASSRARVPKLPGASMRPWDMSGLNADAGSNRPADHVAAQFTDRYVTAMANDSTPLPASSSRTTLARSWYGCSVPDLASFARLQGVTAGLRIERANETMSLISIVHADRVVIPVGALSVDHLLEAWSAIAEQDGRFLGFERRPSSPMDMMVLKSAQREPTIRN